MQFTTEFTPEKLPQPLRQTDEILTIGSCFADVIGRHLADHKLNISINPFGTIFNPVSMAKLLRMTLNGTPPDENLYLERDGVWFHYDFHSSLWAHSRDSLAEKLSGTLHQVGETLRRADWLFLTFGTAMVYRHTQTAEVVANCHKMPAALFEKYLYSFDHVRDTLTQLLKTLRRANPKLKILLTVSPVRHTRDTLPLNQVSKSLLRLVCHELTVWHEFAHYFPSYEIMVDDLRDYRFYEADLIHPNAVAHEYIFQKFGESLFDDELRTFVTEWAGIRKSLAHRPHFGPTEAYERFLRNLLAKLESLPQRVDVSAEMAAVREQLEAFISNRQSVN